MPRIVSIESAVGKRVSIHADAEVIHGAIYTPGIVLIYVTSGGEIEQIKLIVLSMGDTVPDGYKFLIKDARTNSFIFRKIL